MVPRYDTSPADAPPRDTTYTILSERRRRQAVAILAERDAPTALDDLAAAIASRAGADADGGSGATADEIAARLHHVHLPRLADAGVVDYDAETNTVTPTRTGALASLSRIVDEANRSID